MRVTSTSQRTISRRGFSPTAGRTVGEQLMLRLGAGLLLLSAQSCAKSVCEVLLEEQTLRGCAPEVGGAGGKAPESCEGDIEKKAKCQVSHAGDPCRPDGSEQAQIAACVAE